LVAFLLRPIKPRWLNLSFPSTLYLCPILDLLLKEVPDLLHAELRLGLQEALVNAAKHGNRLSPEKSVSVRYVRWRDRHEWVITDQGAGFEPPLSPCYLRPPQDHLPEHGCECGRGLFILFEVFDRVRWDKCGTELSLSKYVRKCK
jgi:serine/threonine-protein kinase RsbW